MQTLQEVGVGQQGVINHSNELNAESTVHASGKAQLGGTYAGFARPTYPAPGRWSRRSANQSRPRRHLEPRGLFAPALCVAPPLLLLELRCRLAGSFLADLGRHSLLRLRAVRARLAPRSVGRSECSAKRPLDPATHRALFTFASILRVSTGTPVHEAAAGRCCGCRSAKLHAVQRRLPFPT